MTPPGLEVVDATVRFGVVRVLTGVSIDVPVGTVVGLIGPNGAGKSTLLDAAGGLVPLDRGRVRVGGSDVTHLPPHRRARLGLARTFQTLDLFDDLTVAENTLVAAEAAGSSEPAVADDRLVATLSHGERKDVALARALAAKAHVLLLDEPAAGLDGAARAELAARLRALAGHGLAVLVADHDLDLVMGLCDEVWVLDFGRVIAHGPPGAVRDDPAVVAAYLGEGGPTAAPSRRRQKNGSDVLLEARGLVAGYGGVPAIRGVDLTVHAGEVVALLGANGAGKTTTLRAVSGVLPLMGGRATALGGAVDGRPHRLARRGLAHVPQDRAVLATLTVAENLRLAAAGAGRFRRRPADGTPANRELERFPALTALLHRRAGTLSGGEQQLLALARALARDPRLLLVDEPSMGLAPRAARQALDAVREVADAGGGVVLAEQHPRLALELADRAVVLARGASVFDGPAAELAGRPDLLESAYLGGDSRPHA